MRVLICIDSLGIGGKERQAVELIRGLSSVPEVDCRVVCFAADDFYLDELTATGISVEFIPRRARWDLGVFQRLRQIINTHRPDVIHTNGLVSSFYSLPLAKQRHIPLVNGSIRNAFAKGDYRWTLERVLLKWSDYRVANSRAGLRSRHFSEDDANNLVIYNGFDLARVECRSAAIADAECSAGRDTRIVGMVAEFSRHKDYLTFVEAARILSRTRQDVQFVTVGDGDTLEECQAAARDLSTFRFLGKHRDIEQIVATFDIGVLATFVEGLSNSIMEYMALGKPVVATDGGGTRELVVDGETGFLVRQSDAPALAAAVEYLVEHPDIAKRMGAAGQAKLRCELSLDRMVQETLALYRGAALVSPSGRRNGKTVS
jgi:glycosyltransferase involved in cell wall biosynthesis